MVMEYVPDGSLRKKLGPLDSQKRQSISDAVSIAEGILGGLAVLHEERVCHRDIKPENILMDGRTAKVADLGIARILESDELALSRRGTLYYESPEALGEAGDDSRSDRSATLRLLKALLSILYAAPIRPQCLLMCRKH